MSTDALIGRLAGLLADVTGAPVDSINAQSTPANTKGWDSMANVNFIGAVEDEFNVTITTNETMETKSLADMVKLLERKGVAGA
jgi:acyl carrier protein